MKIEYSLKRTSLSIIPCYSTSYRGITIIRSFAHKISSRSWSNWHYTSYWACTIYIYWFFCIRCSSCYNIQINFTVCTTITIHKIIITVCICYLSIRRTLSIDNRINWIIYAIKKNGAYYIRNTNEMIIRWSCWSISEIYKYIRSIIENDLT